MQSVKKGWPFCSCIALIPCVAVICIVDQQVSLTASEAQTPSGLQKGSESPAKLLPARLKASTSLPEKPWKPPSGQRQRPTLQGLLEKIRSAPGGREILEAARRRGAKLGVRPAEPEPSLSWLNPFRAATAEAVGSWSMTVTPERPSSMLPGQLGPSAGLFYAGALAGDGYPTTSVTLGACSVTVGSTSTTISNPSLTMFFQAPSDGWYVVDIEATGAEAIMLHSDGSSVTTVGSWDYIGREGTLSYPALVELERGLHVLYWYSSKWFVAVYEGSVYSLE